MDHDIHDFVRRSQQELQSEYLRIRKRAADDPGTAGGQGEENWASLFREWLPHYFHVVTKGRILTESGYASPQIDVLILSPAYPRLGVDRPFDRAFDGRQGLDGFAGTALRKP